MPRQYNSPDLIIPTELDRSHELLCLLFPTFVHLPYFSFRQVLFTLLSNLSLNPINILPLASEAKCLIHTKQWVKQ